MPNIPQLSDRIFELSLKRSFFFPSNEPYGGTAGLYDYGPVGVLIKRKIENLWREMFIKSEGFHEVETSIITPEPVLVASGHVGSFADPVIECQKCKAKVRADSFVAEKHFDLHGERWDGQLGTLDRIIVEKELKCPKCGGDFGSAFMFNLMFHTGIGGERASGYSRPETAQGIFTAFPRIFRNHGTRLPIAVGQVGKSFRNEISPRKGLIRMREFTQMELEYFFNPASGAYEGFAAIKDSRMRMGLQGKTMEMSAAEIVEKKLAANEIMAYFMAREWEFYRRVGIRGGQDGVQGPGSGRDTALLQGEHRHGGRDLLREHKTIGNAYRTDFDLSQHAKHSGQDLSVFVEEEKRKVMPHVFELSMGVDRLFYCLLEHCLRDKDVKDEAGNWKLGTGKDWEWFDFPPVIAPSHVSVFPLMKKDGLDAKAREIAAAIRAIGLDAEYRESGSIGRRYARADEIGIPYCLTVDYQTLEDGTVTIRYRNDGKQERIKTSDCEAVLRKAVRVGRVTL